MGKMSEIDMIIGIVAQITDSDAALVPVEEANQFVQDKFRARKIARELGIHLRKKTPIRDTGFFAQETPQDDFTGWIIEFSDKDYHNGWSDNLRCPTIAEAHEKLRKIQDEHLARGETKARRLRQGFYQRLDQIKV